MSRRTYALGALFAATALATPVWAGVVTGEPSSDMAASFDGNNRVVGTGWFTSFSEAAPSAYVTAKQGLGFTVSDSVRPNGNATSADFSGDFSVAVLVKLPTYSVSTPGTIFAVSGTIWQDAGTGLALGQTATGLQVEYVTKASSNTTLLTTDTALEGWASLVLVFDRNPLDENGDAQTGQTTTTLYVNGTAVATNTQATMTPNGTWLALGNIYGGATQVSWAIHSGLVIDEVRGYSSALSATNVETLHNLWLPPTTEASRTVSGSAGMWSTDSDWSPEGVPGENTDVTLTVSEAATLTVDSAATIASLKVEGDGLLTLAATESGSLTTGSMVVNANTDLSDMTTSLGALTVTAGKKLTVGANTSASSWGIGGSTLATKGDFTVSDGLWNMMKSSIGAERPTKLVVESGTLKLKDGSVSDFVIPIEVLATLDINGLCDSHPQLTLMNGAVLKNSGTTRDYNKAQLKNIILVGDAKVSGNTFGSVAGSWASQSLTLGGHTLTVEMSENNTFYLASAGARKSAEEPDAEAGTVKVTSGTLSLYSDKNEDSLKRANVVLAGGTLKVDGKGLLGSLTGTSGTLNLNGKDVSIGNLNGNRNDVFSGVLTGATGSVFRKVGKGTQTLSGDLSGFAGAYQVDDGTLELSVAGELTATVAGSGALKKSGAGTLTLAQTLRINGPVELAAGTLDLGALRPAVTVTGEGATLVLLQGLDDVADDATLSPISLSFADGIASCTVVTKSLGGLTKTLPISVSDVPDGTVNVTFPTETGPVDDTLPEAHRTCGFENRSLTGLSTSGMQDMTFAASPFPGQGNYGQIEDNGRPHSGTGDPNGFVTVTGERGFTFSLKVCPNTCANKGVLLALGQQSAMVALLWQDDSSDATKGHFAVFTNENTSVPVVTSQLVTKTAWHAVSVVSSLETKRVYITVDGEMTKSAVRSTGLSITNGAFQIGSVHSNVPSEWGWRDGNGAQVDDFRFDKVPLTQAQIARLRFHYAVVSANGELANLTEFGTGTQVAISALPASADARISVAEGVTATATLTTPTAATLKVWGAGTLEVAEGESAQTIAAVELKEETTTLLLHRSQADVVTSRVGTVGTFKFSGGTMGSPLMVPYDVDFPGAIAIAANSCVKLNRSTSGNASYQVTGEGQSSIAIIANTVGGWGVINTGSVRSLFSNLTLSLDGDSSNFWIRAGLTNNVWLNIPTGRTVNQEADAQNTDVGGVLTVRNLTGGGKFTSLKANQTLRLLNTDAAASTFNAAPIINDGGDNFKLVFAGNWTVGAALTDDKTPRTIHIGDGSTETTVETAVAFAPGPAYTVQANATLRPTAAVALPASLSLAEGGKVQLTLDTLTLPSALAGTGTVLFGNGTDTFAYALASAPANFVGTYNVAANSTLTLTSAPNRGAGFAGSGTLVIGNGSAATNFTSTKVYPDASQPLTVQVKSPSKLTLNPGAGNFAFPNAVAFDVASGAELILASGMSFFGVSGEGSCSVIGDYVFGVSGTAASAGFPDEAKKLNIATLTVGTPTNTAVTLGIRPFGAIAIAPTTLKVNKNAAIVRDSNTSAKAKASVSLGATATVTGEGTIELPVAFTEGAVLDTVTAAPLLLKGKVTGPIKVKLNKAKAVLTTGTAAELDRNTQLAFASDDDSKKFAADNYRFAETYLLSTHTFAVVPPLELPAGLPEAVTGNKAAQNAIYDAVATMKSFGTEISSVTAVKAQSTGGVAGSTEALALFENLHAEATASAAADGTGTVTVYYDFGISQLHVKSASLVGEEKAQLYVLLCAKVATKQDTTTANYASGTTVSLHRGTEALSAVEPTDVQLRALGITPAAGEKWFAVPMTELNSGTNAFKVKASQKTPAAN